MSATARVSRRLMSLDVLRGLTVIGMILVNATAGLQYGDAFEVYPLLLHARWDGLTIADLVFPAFLMIVGVSIPLAMAGADPGRPVLKPVAGRMARLFLLGLFLSNFYWLQSLGGADGTESSWRFWGVLQRIALVYGACAVLFHLTGPRVRLGLIVGILILYWPLTLAPTPDGLATNLWTPGHNFGAWLDRVLLGDHNYVKGSEGYDPEGLFSTLPAIAHGLIGVTVGEFLLRNRGWGAAGRLAAAGGLMLAAGIGWGFVFPVVKDLWSSSFVLVTCGLTALMLAGLHGLLDGEGRLSPVKTALIVVALPFGLNAIAAYVLHAVAGSMVGWRLLSVPGDWARSIIGEQAAALIPVLLFIAFIWLCMEGMRRRNWIIRI